MEGPLQLPQRVWGNKAEFERLREHGEQVVKEAIQNGSLTFINQNELATWMAQNVSLQPSGLTQKVGTWSGWLGRNARRKWLFFSGLLAKRVADERMGGGRRPRAPGPEDIGASSYDHAQHGQHGEAEERDGRAHSDDEGEDGTGHKRHCPNGPGEPASGVQDQAGEGIYTSIYNWIWPRTF